MELLQLLLQRSDNSLIVLPCSGASGRPLKLAKEVGLREAKAAKEKQQLLLAQKGATEQADDPQGAQALPVP